MAHSLPLVWRKLRTVIGLGWNVFAKVTRRYFSARLEGRASVKLHSCNVAVKIFVNLKLATRALKLFGLLVSRIFKPTFVKEWLDPALVDSVGDSWTMRVVQMTPIVVCDSCRAVSTNINISDRSINILCHFLSLL